MADAPRHPGGGLGFALAAAAQAWRVALGNELVDVAVTPPQFLVLAALLHIHGRGYEPPTQRELAERTGTDANTTSQILRGIERRGLIRREAHARDSRAYALSLTPEGLELARTCTMRARALNDRFFAGADPGLYDTLTALTRRD